MSKISAKHTTVTPLEVVYFQLPIFSYNSQSKTVRVRVTRDNATLTRVNQTLADRGYIERVSLSKDGGVHLLRNGASVNSNTFPDWNETRCWVEFSFAPTKAALPNDSVVEANA